VVSGRKRKCHVTGYIDYGALSVLDRIREKSGKSLASLIAECVDKALPDVEENRVRIPKHLPATRQKYSRWRFGL